MFTMNVRKEIMVATFSGDGDSRIMKENEGVCFIILFFK